MKKNCKLKLEQKTKIVKARVSKIIIVKKNQIIKKVKSPTKKIIMK